MLIVALVLAVIGLAALVTAVVTSNELIAWVCIGASVIGVLLLIVDALRERSRSGHGKTAAGGTGEHTDHESEVTEDYPDEPAESEAAASEAHAESETSNVGFETHDEVAGSEDKRD
jgi:hypothetical protein